MSESGASAKAPRATHAFVGYRRCGKAMFLEADEGQILRGPDLGACLRAGGKIDRVPLEQARTIPLCFGCGDCGG